MWLPAQLRLPPSWLGFPVWRGGVTAGSLELGEIATASGASCCFLKTLIVREGGAGRPGWGGGGACPRVQRQEQAPGDPPLLATKAGVELGQTSERQGRAGPLPVRVSRPFRAQRAGRFRARRGAAAPSPRSPGRQRTDGAGTRTFAHGADAEAEMNQEMKVSNL